MSKIYADNGKRAISYTPCIWNANTKKYKSGTTSSSRSTALAQPSQLINQALWYVAVLRARFSREIGPVLPYESSRRKRTRHTRWRVHFAACNCTAITATCSLVWLAVSLSHTLARNRSNRHVSAKLARVPILVYDFADKRRNWFSPPSPPSPSSPPWVFLW